jgi:HEAT repeat protein
VALWALWYASLALVAVSIAVMLLLVLRRVVRQRLDRHSEALRAEASATLLAYLEGKATTADILHSAGGRIGIVTDLVFQMRELVRGQDAARLVEAARGLGGFEQAAKRLRSRNPAVRAEAVRRLAMYGTEAAPLLGELLGDRNAGVRIAAAIELTILDRAPSIAILADALRLGDVAYSEDHRRIFRPAAAADPAQAVTLLEDQWTPEAVRLLLLDGLAQAGALQALPALCAEVQHGSPAVRAEALRALATLGHPAAAPVVLDALHDPHWWVRAQAANAVRRIGIVEATATLGDLLDDEQWWVRFRAAEALCTLGSEGQEALKEAGERPGPKAQVVQLVMAERGLA